MNWTRVSPVYPVADVAAAIEWYSRVLGFKPQVVNPPAALVPIYAVLTHDGASAHLLRLDHAPYGLRAPVQAQFWIGSNLDELFLHVESLGAQVLQKPGDQPWGHRDFMIADPDGNIVWVTQPLRLSSASGDEPKAGL